MEKVRLFANEGLLEALGLMAKATGKSEEEVLEDLVLSTESHHLVNKDSYLMQIDNRVKGMHSEKHVNVTSRVAERLRFFCVTWRVRIEELLVVCIYYSHKTAEYMKLVRNIAA